MESSIGRWLPAVLMGTSGLHRAQPRPHPWGFATDFSWGQNFILFGTSQETTVCHASERRISHPDGATEGISEELWGFVCLFLVYGIAISFWLSRHQEEAVCYGGGLCWRHCTRG